jgi:hypothetical protein
MPTYDYHCDTNGQTIEVKHSMSEVLNSWGELCEQAGIDLGDTPANTPVRRLISGGQIIRSSSLGDADAPACSTGTCSSGLCGLN